MTVSHRFSSDREKHLCPIAEEAGNGTKREKRLKEKRFLSLSIPFLTLLPLEKRCLGGQSSALSCHTLAEGEGRAAVRLRIRPGRANPWPGARRPSLPQPRPIGESMRAEVGNESTA